MLAKRLIKSNDAGGGACTNTVDLYNPFPDGGGVALYQLNGNANDVSGNYDGTATNVTYGAGQFGQAGVFNGSSSIIKNGDLGVDFRGKTELSVSCWFKTNQSVALQSLFGFSATGDASTELFVNIRSEEGNALGFLNRNDGSGIVEVRASGSGSVIDNVWHNVVFVASTSGTKLYLDGSELTSMNYRTGSASTQISMPSDLNQFNIGGSQDSGGIEFLYNGSIDQVRIFSRALRPYEVEALYTEEYCTPTIVPSEHFNTITYSGDGQARSFTGVGFQPDLVWFKNRNDSFFWHTLWDSVRGPAKDVSSNVTDPENTNSSRGYLTSFDVDGMSVVPGSVDIGNMNAIGNDVVAWCWKAGGAAVTNTDGVTSGIYTGVTSQVSANTDSGFSIQTFTSSGSGKVSWGHGLGVVPKLIILKSRSATGSWEFISPDLIGASYGLRLNTTAAATNYTNDYAFFDSSKIDIGSSNYNISGSTDYVSYAFAEVEGLSNFGSYVGTGASGNTIVTGFEPAFVMIKSVNSTSSWAIFDDKRDTTNPRHKYLRANDSTAEVTTIPSIVNFLNNGFEVNVTSSGFNGLNGEYIYMAFAADPTTIEPTLEDSFNTVLYTGNGVTGSRSITGVGFQPDFVWTKQISAGFHGLHTSVQGKPYQFTNLTAAEQADAWYNNYGWVDSYDSDGFTLIGGNDVNNGTINASGIDYVAWNWKGAELPAINSNGSIPSVVSANPAAGFSIVSYTGNYTNSTVGHGLGVAPNVVIVKSRGSGTANWCVYHSSIGATGGVFLNLTNAAQYQSNLWLDTEPTNEVFSIGQSDVNVNNSPTIAYCFAEVAGFSKFGSYTGNGTTGNKQTINFEPAFVLIKRTNPDGGAWSLYDNKRSPTNPRDKKLVPNSSAAENVAGTTYQLNFYSDGFDFNGGGYDLNGSGGTYIYMAFANQF